jgi:very-short-patch-repair endonuclease
MTDDTMVERGERRVPWKTPPELWEKLKPLAREMRHAPTPAEDMLWQHIRNRQVSGAKFRRQHTIDRFVVDFYCREAHLVIEVDGDIHQYTQAADAVRQEFLKCGGLRVLRFHNDQVTHQMDTVLAEIRSALEEGKR